MSNLVSSSDNTTAFVAVEDTSIHHGIAGLTFASLVCWQAYFQMSRHTQAWFPTPWTHKLMCWIILLSAIVFMNVSLSIYRQERFLDPRDSADILKQLRNNAEQPAYQPPTLLGVGGSLCLLAVLIQHDFREAPRMDATTLWGLTLGWFAYALAASTPDQRLDHIEPQRISWTFPGALLWIISSMWCLSERIEHPAVYTRSGSETASGPPLPLEKDAPPHPPEPALDHTSTQATSLGSLTMLLGTVGLVWGQAQRTRL